MKFEIVSGSAKLTHINLRTEQHGDEEKPAIDLKFEHATANDALNLVHPDLLESIFQEAPGDRAQAHVAGVPRVLKALIFPDMKPFGWASELTGMRLTIDHGMGGKSDLVMGDCTVDKFVIRPLEGGTVEFTFRVRTTDVNAKLLDRLLGLLGHDVPLSLIRQNDPTEGEASADVTPIAKGKKKSQSVQQAFEATAE